MRQIITVWLALLLSPPLSAQTVTDTLWSVPQLDGTICYRPGSGTFNMSTSSFGFSPGDGFDVLLGEEVSCRNFLVFNLSELSNSDTSSIINSTIGIYQFNAWGNEQPNTYPIWNVAGGDTHFCVLDHIDYGSSLDLGDWTAGDPGDPQTLHTNIGIISDNAVVEYKTMDVTGYVKEDIVNGRIHNQYRMRFTIDTDFDHLADGLDLRSGNSIITKPYLAVSYDTTSIVINDPGSVISNFVLKQNYPNPFNPTTEIRYAIPTSQKVTIAVYNILGQKIKTLLSERLPAGEHSVVWDGRDDSGQEVSSGIYFYQIRAEKFREVKRALLVH